MSDSFNHGYQIGYQTGRADVRSRAYASLTVFYLVMAIAILFLTAWITPVWIMVALQIILAVGVCAAVSFISKNDHN